MHGIALAMLLSVQAPYFQVDTKEAVLPLKSSHTEVTVAGVIAHARVTQTWQNTGTKPLEGVYVFPGSTKSAVFGMQMVVGERTIKAEINKRDAARTLYESAKQSGKSASLLEQDRPNVFRMSVANILPREEIRVELDYTELLVPDGNEYELVIPAVVGPRYDEEANLAQRQAAKGTHAWTAKVTVNAGMPIQSMNVPSHDVKTKFASKRSASAALRKGDAGDRDFIVRYRLAGDGLQTGLLLHESDDENFFLMMVQPPERVQPRDIPPRSYTFVVDVSGSMHGFPLDVSKTLIAQMLDDLRPRDRFNMLFFSGGNYVLSEQSLPATKKNIERAIAELEQLEGAGTTQLLPALERAFEMEEAGGTSRTIVVATDGYVAIEAEAFDLIRNELGTSNLFAFGIGKSVNRHIIEGMSRVGMGEPFVAGTRDEALDIAARFADYVRAPALTDVAVDIDGFDAYDIEPKSIPDVFAQRPVLLFGKYKGEPQGTLTVRGHAGDGKWTHQVRVADYDSETQHSALPYLWARHRIALLSDLQNLHATDERVETVTKLGLDYHLMTAYTSFVATDSVVRTDGQVVSVKQPVPLPKGMDDRRVSESAGVLGAMGMGMSGSGRGGGGTAIGVGSIGTKGRGSGASGSGHGVGVGHFGKGKGDATIRLSGEETLVVGYDKKVIDTIIKRHLAQLQYCYEKQLRRNPKLYGKVIIQFKLGKDGTVETVSVKSSTFSGTGKSEAEACIASRIKALRFPAPKGETVSVTYPFLFESSD